MVQPTAIDYDHGRIYEPMTWNSDTDARRRRDGKTNSNPQPPRMTTTYSPTNGNHPASPYQQVASRPSNSSAISVHSIHSPHRTSLPSPKMNGAINHGAIFDQRDCAHTFYDAVSDHREGQASWNPHYHVSSPTQVPLPLSRIQAVPCS